MPSQQHTGWLAEWLTVVRTYRPTYLHVANTIRKHLKVSCILAITATCSLEAEVSITELLGIERPSGVLRKSPVRPNLFLSASTDKNKYATMCAVVPHVRLIAMQTNALDPMRY
jgi:superfamily II DNA helicase RecQ